jgi:hypothetical protein
VITALLIIVPVAVLFGGWFEQAARHDRINVRVLMTLIIASISIGFYRFFTGQ